MLASTLRQGSSAGSWKTNPSSLSRCASIGSSPKIEIEPELGACRPAISRSSEVLPQPLGPTSETNWPAGMLNEVGATASSGPPSAAR